MHPVLTTLLQDASSKEEWRKLGFDNPQIGWVMESAFDIATTVGSDAYTATRTILPGGPPLSLLETCLGICSQAVWPQMGSDYTDTYKAIL